MVIKFILLRTLKMALYRRALLLGVGMAPIALVNIDKEHAHTTAASPLGSS